MVIYAHRVETTLTDDLYELLISLANQSGREVDDLVRDAIVQAYGTDVAHVRRLAALRQLLSLDLDHVPDPLQAPEPPPPEAERAETILPTGIAFVDADVCIHATVPHSPAREACAWIMTEIAHKRLSAAIDVEVLRELADGLRHAGETDKGYHMTTALQQILPIIYPVDDQDLQLAAELCRMSETTGIRFSGCVHLAVMQHNGLNTILSLNPSYDELPDIVRVNPLALHQRYITGRQESG